MLKLLLLTLALQVILFCGYLKWQLWNTRLHLPLFMIGILLICYVASVNSRFKKALYILAPVVLIYAFILVLHNALRPYFNVSSKKPYITSAIFSAEGRYKKYFANRPLLYPEYQQVSADIESSGYKNIGLILAANDWEYPLFTDCYTRQLNPVHLNIHNITSGIKSPFSTVDCIVSTYVNKPYIDHDGRRFYNHSGKNKYVYIYQ